MNPDQIVIQSVKAQLGDLTFEVLRLSAHIELQAKYIAELEAELGSLKSQPAAE